MLLFGDGKKAGGSTGEADSSSARGQLILLLYFLLLNLLSAWPPFMKISANDVVFAATGRGSGPCLWDHWPSPRTRRKFHLLWFSVKRQIEKKEVYRTLLRDRRPPDSLLRPCPTMSSCLFAERLCQKVYSSVREGKPVVGRILFSETTAEKEI